jgi:hypothetical protein
VIITTVSNIIYNSKLLFQIDEVKEELETVVKFLKDPKKYATMGAKIPKGKQFYCEYQFHISLLRIYHLG